MKFPNLTLGRKTILLTTLGLFLGLGLFSSLSIVAVNQSTDTMLRDRMTTANIVADYIDEVLARALSELRDTTHGLETDLLNSDVQGKMTALRSTYSRLSIYTYGTYLLNSGGRVVWGRTEAGETGAFDLAAYPGINEAMAGGEAIISGLVLAPETDIPVIFLACPTGETDEDNRHVLVVAINLAESSIAGFVQPIRLGQTGYVEIVDQNGIVVTRTEPGPKLAPFEKSDHSGHFAALIAAGEPTRGLCHTCHEPVQKVERRDVLAFAPLSEARWGVAIRQSEEEALAPVRQLRQNLLIAGGALVTVVLASVTVTTRNTVGRIRALTTASRRIAGGDLASPVFKPRQEDELGELAQTFDDMRARLQTSYGELERKTRELSTLLSVSEMLSFLPDLSRVDNALGSALEESLAIIEADAGAILLYDGGHSLDHIVHRGLAGGEEEQVSAGLAREIDARAVESGEVVAMEAADADKVTFKNMLGIPLRSKERVLGFLCIVSRQPRLFSLEDTRLLRSIAGQIATSVENARLHQEIQQKEKIRGELLRDILSIQEEERKRIARELHDETSQVLSSLTASLEAAAGMLPKDAEKIKAILMKSQSLSINLLDEISRLVYQLRPTLLDDLGLVAATRWLLENSLEAIGVDVHFQVKGRQKRLASQVEASLFRVIQEGVSNIARHAQAKRAGIIIYFGKSSVTVHVEDDGLGFDFEEAVSSKSRPRGLGLLGMRERVDLMNGTMNIQSSPGNGTKVDIEISI
jgi:signal transduction histidine kinase